MDGNREWQQIKAYANKQAFASAGRLHFTDGDLQSPVYWERL